jgi:cytochrome c553
MLFISLVLAFIYFRHKSIVSKLIVGRAMAQAVSRRPLTAETQVSARVSPCGICHEQSGAGRASPSSSVCPVSVIQLGLHIYMSSGS